MKAMYVVSAGLSLVVSVSAMAEWGGFDMNMKRYTSHCTVTQKEGEACVDISLMSVAPLKAAKDSPCKTQLTTGPCDRKDFVCGYAVGFPPHPGEEDGSMRFRYFSSDPAFVAKINKECNKNVASGKLTNMVRRIDVKKAE